MATDYEGLRGSSNPAPIDTFRMATSAGYPSAKACPALTYTKSKKAGMLQPSTTRITPAFSFFDDEI